MLTKTATEPFEINCYAQRKERQHALRVFTTDLRCHYFNTLAPNNNMSLKYARHFLNDFDKTIQTKLFGRKYYEIPLEERTFFIAFLEHINSNLHFHLIMNVPQHKRVAFEFYAPILLKQIIKSATIDIQRTETLPENRMSAYYSCKELLNEENYNNFVISTEFSKLPYRHPACSLSMNT